MAVPSMGVVSIIPGVVNSVSDSLLLQAAGGSAALPTDMKHAHSHASMVDKKQPIRKPNESDAEREARMEKRRQRERLAREQETPEEKEARRKKRRDADNARMAQLAQTNELQERKLRRRQKDTERRHNMTEEQREAFNAKRRENHRRRKEMSAAGQVSMTQTHTNTVPTALPAAISADAIAVPNALSMMHSVNPVQINNV